MNREELREVLIEKGISDGLWCLDGMQDGECLCLLHDKKEWVVLYNSKGRIGFSERFDNEEAACNRFYEVMKEDFGWRY